VTARERPILSGGEESGLSEGLSWTRSTGAQTAREWNHSGASLGHDARTRMQRHEEWMRKKRAPPPATPWSDVTAVDSLKTFEQINLDQ
jgi:hypothetical protein